MLGIAVAHARCGVYGFGICMPRGGDKVADDHFAARFAGIDGVPAFRAGRSRHFFRIGMPQCFHITVFIRISAGIAGMRRIALLRTGGRGHFLRIIMPRFVHERVRILIAARCTEMRDVSLMRTGRRHGDVLKGMPLCRHEIVRIAVAAVCTGIDGIALLRTGRRKRLHRLVVMVAGAVFGGIHRSRSHRSGNRFCRRRTLRRFGPRFRTARSAERRDKPDRENGDKFP